MEIIKKTKLKQLKACRKACQRIYELLNTATEDKHGNVISYRHDKTKKEILNILAEAGYGKMPTVEVEGWEYDYPWDLEAKA